MAAETEKWSDQETAQYDRLAKEAKDMKKELHTLLTLERVI